MSKVYILFLSLLISAGTILGAQNGFWTEPTRGATGARPPTKAEREWMRKNLRQVTRVRLNDLAVRRINDNLDEINAWRQKHGKKPVTQEMIRDARDRIAKITNENEGRTGTAVDSVPSGTADAGAEAVLAAGDLAGGVTLPSAVDNSALPSFPEIRSQGGIGSCVSFSIAYSQLTHETGLRRGWNNKNTDNTTKFSPKFLYNMVNGGGDYGSSWYGNYVLIQAHGAPTWAQYPYLDASLPATNYLEWCLTPATWLSAIDYRIREWGELWGYDTSASGMTTLKTMMLNGHIFTGGLYAYSFVYTNVKNDPATSSDDSFADQMAIGYVDGYDGGHSMTFVGYNDNIWIDLNQNNVVDPGEKGAFKLANSWGADWGNAGFVWVSYDAFYEATHVTGGPAGSGMRHRFLYAGPYWITVRDYYKPRVVAKFTVNQSVRNNIGLAFNVAPVDNSISTAVPSSFEYAGGAFAFDGTTTMTPVDATFYVDMSDAVPSPAKACKYQLTLCDGNVGAPSILKVFSITDYMHGGTTVATTDALPRTLDGTCATFNAQYTFTNTNQAPVADFSVSPSSGTLPLSVTCNASASYDPDGTIAGYHWDFGDNATSAGSSTVTHTFTSNNGGLPIPVTLTVVDTWGDSAKTFRNVTIRAPLCLTTDKTAVAFGNAAVGSLVTSPLILINECAAATTVTAITSNNARFKSLAALPLTVAGNTALSIQVQFAPTSQTIETGTLTITSNASNNPAIPIALSGTGTAASHVLRSFVVTSASASTPLAGSRYSAVNFRASESSAGQVVGSRYFAILR
jgi:PKD repeat protein